MSAGGRKFDLLTFDCYGTLIDWESGILNALRPFLAEHGIEAGDEEILELYAKLESAAETGIHVPYRHVLIRVLRGFGTHYDVALPLDSFDLLVDSIGNWRAFPDTAAALGSLSKRYRLGVISNVDDDLFEATRPALGAEIDWIVTAEQVKSYKPSLRNFELAVERVGVPPERWLHAAQSLYHDVTPAREFGMTTIWVNRRRGREGFGATLPAAAIPHLEVGSLEELATLVDHAFA